jgi:hypothetical protein
MYPVRGKSEASMLLELQRWLADVLAYEVRFKPMDETAKRCGLQALIPEAMWMARMTGQQYESYDALLKHVKDIVGDRTLAAMRGSSALRGTGHSAQGAQPMDIGQMADGLYYQNEWPDAGDADLNVFQPKGKGKGAWGQGKGAWGQPPTWEQPQPKGGKKGGKDGGKGGKGGKDGAKGGKGKGKDVQCWTCSGWGHRSNQCPSGDGGKGGKGGVNEVDEAPTQEEPEIASEEVEEPAWLGMLTEEPLRWCRPVVSQTVIANVCSCGWQCF